MSEEKQAVIVNVGVDIGTTQIVATIMGVYDTEPKLINLTGRTAPMASAIYFAPDGTMLFGDQARRNAVTQPERVIQLFKQFIRTKKTWEIDGKTYSPADGYTLCLRRVNEILQSMFPDAEFVYTVTVPANYGTPERMLVRNASEAAGIFVSALINEPTAAALHYYRNDSRLVGRTIGVVDLGGGTLDVTVMRAVNEDGQLDFEVLACKGVESLGGERWTAEGVYRPMLERYCAEAGISPEQVKGDIRSDMTLRALAEECKIELSQGSTTTVIVLPIRPDVAVNFEMTQDEFERNTADLLSNVIDTFGQAVASARERDADLVMPSDVILAGGASMMPQIATGLVASFPDLEGRISIKDPFIAIASGASLYATMGLKVRDRLTKSYGCIAIDSRNDKERVFNHLVAGAEIPCSFERRYYTMADGQRSILDRIIENVSEEPSLNPNSKGARCIGKMRLELPPDLPKGTPVDTVFRTDAGAILSVKSTCAGKEISTTIEIAPKLVDEKTADPFSL